MTVIAQGISTDGDIWELDVDGSVEELSTMVRVVGRKGRQGEGCRGPALYPGRRVNTYMGSKDQGARVYLARVAADVRAVVVTLSDGTREDLVLHGDVGKYGARVAVLVYARKLDIHRVDLYGADGAMLAEEY